MKVTDEQQILIFIEKLKPLPAIIQQHASEFKEEVEKRGEKWLPQARFALLVAKLDEIGDEAKAIDFENPKLKKAFETIGNSFNAIAGALHNGLVTTLSQLIQQIKFRLQELLKLVTKELTGETMLKGVSTIESIGKALGI